MFVVMCPSLHCATMWKTCFLVSFKMCTEVAGTVLQSTFGKIVYVCPSLPAIRAETKFLASACHLVLRQGGTCNSNSLLQGPAQSRLLACPVLLELSLPVLLELSLPHIPNVILQERSWRWGRVKSQPWTEILAIPRG